MELYRYANSEMDLHLQKKSLLTGGKYVPVHLRFEHVSSILFVHNYDIFHPTNSMYVLGSISYSA
jgi:hypothetical protein